MTEVPAKTIAVITRTNREVERVLSLLESSGVSVAAERGTDIFSHPAGRLYFYLLEFLADQSKVEALAQTLASGLWQLDFTDSASLIRQIRGGDLREVEKKILALKDLKKALAKSGPIEYLIRVGEESGFIELVAQSPLSVEVWRSIIALAQDLAHRKLIENPRQLIEELLTYRQTAETRSLKISAGAPSAVVRIMTAHGAKGLEYDYVFLPYVTEESWLSRHRGSYFVLPAEKAEGDEVSDARRLFYVAITRAREHASIILGLEDGLRRPLTPLRFIDELDANNVARIFVSADTINVKEDEKNSKISVEMKINSELINYAKNILLEKGLSVTALNHWCECPNKFFYKSILKLPEAPSGSAEKGNAMHEAIAAVWALPTKNLPIIIETLRKTIEEYFVRSPLSFYDKEVILEELALNVPKVASALADHFSAKGQISAERWVETFFTSDYDGESIELKLHGKMDAIVDTPTKVFVYDYKTKSAMSVPAIKGETKNDDGNYFRQLIFYKILMAGNNFYRDKTIEPALVFVKPDDKGRCPVITIPITLADVERVKKEIKALIESVWSGALLTATCSDPKCEFCAKRALTMCVTE